MTAKPKAPALIDGGEVPSICSAHRQRVEGCPRCYPDYVPACQSLLDDDTRCPEIATHIVKGRPGYRWYGVHCEAHARITATHYDHQGGCVVARIDGRDDGS